MVARMYCYDNVVGKLDVIGIAHKRNTEASEATLHVRLVYIDVHTTCTTRLATIFRRVFLFSFSGKPISILFHGVGLCEYIKKDL